jgi:hypothetical protein
MRGPPKRKGACHRTGYNAAVRWPLTIVSALCLLLFLGTMVLWVRSDTTRSAWTFYWRGSEYAIASERGGLGIDNTPQLQNFYAERNRKMQAVNLRRRIRGLIDRQAIQAINAQMQAIMVMRPPVPFRRAIPYWAISACLLVLPAAWLVHFHRRSVRHAGGRCAACGYDLRGNISGVCPECGTPIMGTAEVKG